MVITFAIGFAVLFANRLGLSNASSKANFLQPLTLYGPGFGPPVGVPFTFQFGTRVDF